MHHCKSECLSNFYFYLIKSLPSEKWTTVHKGALGLTPGIPGNRNIYHSAGLPGAGAGLSSLMVKAWSGSATSKMPVLPSVERLNQGFHHRMGRRGFYRTHHLNLSIDNWDLMDYDQIPSPVRKWTSLFASLYLNFLAVQWAPHLFSKVNSCNLRQKNGSFN